jgi:hypothetical protein
LALAIAALWRKGRIWSGTPTRTAAEVAVPLLLGLLAYTYGQTLLLNVRWGWSAERLAPTLALFHGYPLYSPRDTGPINGWIHGPIAPLLWIPAALADSPLPALSIAAAINLLVLLGPLLFASVQATGGRGPGRLLGFAFSAAALLLVYPTWYMASVLCTDAVAVGLGLASCLVLLARPGLGIRPLLLAAGLAVLATWTKQIEAPLVFAQLGWIWVVAGARAARRYAGIYLAVAAAVSAVLLLGFNARDLLLNMWTIPRAQKLVGSWAGAAFEVREFLVYSLVFSLPCMIALGFYGRSPPAEPGRRSLRSSLGLLVAAAVVLLPLGAMASIKIGGDRNSIHSVYYLAAAAAVAIGDSWGCAASWAWLGRTAALLAAAATGALAARQVHGYPSMSMLPPRCLSQEAWAYARQHPFETYFPQDPLATLMAEGRMYHFDYAVLDRKYGGVVATPEHIREDLPPRLAAVVYPQADGPKEVLTDYLPGYVFARATGTWLIYRPRATLTPSPETRAAPPEAGPQRVRMK